MTPLEEHLYNHLEKFAIQNSKDLFNNSDPIFFSFQTEDTELLGKLNWITT